MNSKTGKNDLINFVIIETKDDKKNIYLATVGRGLLSCSKQGRKTSFIPFNSDEKLLLGFQLQGIDFDKPTSKQ